MGPLSRVRRRNRHHDRGALTDEPREWFRDTGVECAASLAAEATSGSVAGPTAECYKVTIAYEAITMWRFQ
jgi:hypothetical protein